MALQRVVVLATGGTIAGAAADPGEHLAYTAALRGIDGLVAAVPALASWPLETEQIAQIDSKDMDIGVWRALAQRLSHHLARSDVAGIVITHGTDTLDETAYVLQRLLAPCKPVVLTAAMRPATATQADGPQNLVDAVALCHVPGAGGVLVAVAGAVHSPLDVRKTHTYRIDAFGSGDAGVLGRIEAGRLRRFREWPRGTALGASLLDQPWPQVEVVMSHAGADGRVVDALLAAGVDGIVAVGTGNGTLHERLSAALRRAHDRGVVVRRATRVAEGAVLDAPGNPTDWPAYGSLTPAQARLALSLELLQGRAAG